MSDLVNVRKPVLEEDDKIEIGQRLGSVLQKYPTARLLQAAKIEITLTIFERFSRSGTKGNIVELSGCVEKIDFPQNRVVVDGRKLKLGDILHVSVPSCFESEEEYVEEHEACVYTESFNESDDRNAQISFNYSDYYNQAYPSPGYNSIDERIDYDLCPDYQPDYDAEIVMQQRTPPPRQAKRHRLAYR